MISNNVVSERIDNFLEGIDGRYANKYRKLTYDKEKSVIKNEDANIYELNVFFEKENLKRKLSYLTKTRYVKYYFREDNGFIFHMGIPRIGEYDYKTEHDSIDEVWKFYYCRYGNRLSNKKLTIDNKSFDVHGEVDFNFCIDKIDDFKYIVENDSKASIEKKKLAYELLDCCSYYNYSLVNFSVMPSVGNLQSTKSNIGSDRFDVFIWALDLYGSEIDLLLNSHTTVQNMKELIVTLNSFQPIKLYYEIMYDISDSKLIDELVESGKKELILQIEYLIMWY